MVKAKVKHKPNTHTHKIQTHTFQHKSTNQQKNEKNLFLIIITNNTTTPLPSTILSYSSKKKNF